jgi:hypothetical protein
MISGRARIPVVAGDGRAEHAEWGIWAAKQPDAYQDEGADQQNAGAGPEHAHQAASLAGRVGKNRSCLMPVGA